MKTQSDQYYWGAEKIVVAVEKFIQQNERLPVAREMNAQHGLPVCRTFERTMGMTWGQYARLHYPELTELNAQRHKQRVLDIRCEMSEWTQEGLLLAVERFALQNGRLPLKQEYTAENGLPSYTTFCKIAEQTMLGYMENRFGEYICQSSQSEAPQEDCLSFEMNQSF